jgi:hypothetical protein
MYLSGRYEKRVVKVIPVCLVDAERLQVVEEAMMVNLSSRGARVLTTNQWRPNEEPEIVLLSDVIQTQAKIIYCEPLPDGRFCIGLKFLSAVTNGETGIGFPE